MIRAVTGALALSIGVLAACAAPQKTTTAEAQVKDQARCERIYRVGSYIPVIRCQPDVSEAERQQLIDEWGRAARPVYGQKKPAGGG